jgi:hypothetical protein
MELLVIEEKSGPPAPVRKMPAGFGNHERVEYPFGKLEPGGCAYRFPRTANTVRDKLYNDYLKQPENEGKKFVVRPISPTTCRVWRVK